MTGSKNTQFNTIPKGLLIILINSMIVLHKQSVNAETSEREIIDPIETSNISVCITKSCQDAETRVINTIDPSVNPCSNFFKFVCGGFEKNNIVPKSAAGIDQFTIVMDKILDQVKKVVEEEIDPNEPKSFQLVKTYYSSCINTTAINSQGLQPLYDMIKTLGGWPVLEGNSWKGENFTWEGLDRKLQSLGHRPKYIFTSQVIRDLHNASKHAFHLSDVQSVMGQNLLEGLEDKVTKAYYNFMVDVAVQLGADRNHAMKDMKEALMFEIHLLNSTSSAEYIPSDMLVDHATIKNLQQMYPYVSWIEYLNNVTYPTGNFNESYEINIANPIYMYQLKFILNSTSNKVIANYMVWKAIEESIPYLTNDIRSKKFLVEKELTGQSEPESREKECLQILLKKDEGLLVGITAMYVKKYSKDNTRKKVYAIVTQIQEYYDSILKTNSWLNEKTREMALKKNKGMKRIIGFPDELHNISIIDKFYENVQLSADNYFHNVMKMKHFVYHETISHLQRTPDEIFWFEVGVPPAFIPHYNQLYNTIVLPASSLQPPFFDEDQPNYMNYGSFGLLVGHEISHAFDLGTIQLDENGSMKNWWTEEDIDKYQEKYFCFIEQYNNFTIAEPNVNTLGSNTFDENIADNQGSKTAFNVYKNWTYQHGIEPRLSYLNYTNEQLFWISAGSTLCSKKTQEAEQLLRSIDVHAPDELRVMGYVSNSKEFSESFNCPIGSPMNPLKKCSVW